MSAGRGKRIVAILGAAFVVGTLAPATEAGAQVVTGSVTDASTGASLEGVLVRLLNLDGNEVWAALTDDSGWFALRGPGAGEYFLEAQRIGYRTSRAGPLLLETTRATEVELRLAPEAVRLDSLTVTVEPRQTALERVGFYARRGGEGVFIDRAEIDRRRATSLASLLQGRRGVLVMAAPGGGLRVVLRGGVSTSIGGGQFCAPRIFVDGMVTDSLGLEREIHPTDLEGVEVYASPSAVPPQFGGATATCGVILLWTRVSGGPAASFAGAEDPAGGGPPARPRPSTGLAGPDGTGPPARAPAARKGDGP